MIPAFVSSLEDGSELQVVGWNGSKAETHTLEFNIYDSQHDRFSVANSITTSSNSDHYYITTVSTGGQESIPVPQIMEMTTYPNPFNPYTTISFCTPKLANVQLSVYNLKGQFIRSLVNENKTSGYHKVVWDGKDNDGNRASSGIYFIRLQSEGNILTQRVLLMK